MTEPAFTHTLERGGQPLFASGGLAFPGPEWLLTDGRGGYAMGTASGCRTRRYHGLRVAALDPPLARAVLLAEALGAVRTPDGVLIEISTCAFEGAEGGRVLAPSGWERLVRFERSPEAVRWTFSLGGEARLSRTLRLTGGGMSLRHRLEGVDSTAWRLRLSPMLAWRDHHHLLDEADGPRACRADPGGCVLHVSGSVHGRSAEATLSLEGGHFRPSADWWRDIRLATEAERGQDDAEDLFVPGSFEADLSAERTLRLEPDGSGGTPLPLRPKERPTALPAAAADFRVARPAPADGHALTTVLAGYPWFADWGRDAFIALPGLLLVDRRPGHAERGQAEAAGVLRAFAGALRGGLVPNRFGDDGGGEAEYNTLDGSMWFVHAALAWAEARAAPLLPGWWVDAVTAVLDAHLAGTEADGHHGERIPVFVGDDGLVCAGDASTQLTWMDAACPTPAHPEGEVFTPRGGKPVEVNALWVSNLAGAAAVLPGGRERYGEAADRAAASFRALFWSDRLGRLLDVVSADGEPDETLRPNMLIAAALERSPLSAAERGACVAAARNGGLVTPVGLRTLPPGDPGYHPRMTGPPHERDAAYHRGTIWPWLIGPYAEAVLRAGGFSAEAKREAAAAIAPLQAYADSPEAACLGQLPENFDAEPGADGRWTSRGCPAQAWSVAEVRRVAALLAR